MARMQQMQTQGQGPCVTVNGEVRNHVVPWTEGMTLAKALVAADYYRRRRPGPNHHRAITGSGSASNPGSCFLEWTSRCNRGM